MIVAFAGVAGSGKDYAANMLSEMVAPRVTRQYKFAERFKMYLRDIYGLTENHTDGDLKEVPCEKLGGYTPRQVMQDEGVHKRKYDENVWIKLTCRNIYRDMCEPRITLTGEKQGAFVASHIIQKVDVALITDMRYPNEAAAVREIGGKVVFMKGKSCTKFNMHESETVIAEIEREADLVIDNRSRNERILMVELEKLL